jgi:hypothetical protein
VQVQYPAARFQITDGEHKATLFAGFEINQAPLVDRVWRQRNTFSLFDR